jgi:hypothetical protein
VIEGSLLVSSGQILRQAQDKSFDKFVVNMSNHSGQVSSLKNRQGDDKSENDHD